MIYVITAVHNRYNITEKFVNQLLSQSYKDIRLILVDDGSTDGTAEMVKRKMPDAVILHGNGNLWWGGALHRAYQWIRQYADRSAYVMFANDDTAFDHAYIEQAIRVLSGHEKILLTGYGISKQTGSVLDGAIIYDPKEGAYVKTGLGEGDCASTRSLFFRVSDFLIIGGFHPILLPHYASDYEWTIRACSKYGYTVICKDSVTYLADQSSTGDNFYHELTLKKVFSKRSVTNPVYRLSFLLFVTPKKYLFHAVKIQLKRYLEKSTIIINIMRKR